MTAGADAHAGWRAPVGFTHHGSTKWATYRRGLKSFIEAGAGAPSPHDVRIAFPDQGW